MRGRNANPGRSPVVQPLSGRHCRGLRIHPGVDRLRSEEQAAAKAAGCAFIHAAYGFGAVPEAEVSIGSLGELERLLSFD